MKIFELNKLATVWKEIRMIFKTRLILLKVKNNEYESKNTTMKNIIYGQDK